MWLGWLRAGGANHTTVNYYWRMLHAGLKRLGARTGMAEPTQFLPVPPARTPSSPVSLENGPRSRAQGSRQLPMASRPLRAPPERGHHRDDGTRGSSPRRGTPAGSAGHRPHSGSGHGPAWQGSQRWQGPCGLHAARASNRPVELPGRRGSATGLHGSPVHFDARYSPHRCDHDPSPLPDAAGDFRGGCGAPHAAAYLRDPPSAGRYPGSSRHGAARARESRRAAAVLARHRRRAATDSWVRLDIDLLT